MEVNVLKRFRERKSRQLFMLYRLAYFLPDEIFLKLKYRIVLGKKLNLNNPVEFNEKLQWLKIHNRKPLYTILVDKAMVKDYVSKIIGEKYIIPTIGVWNKYEDIDFKSLPDQFVLKTTHGGGNFGVFVCRDKQSIDYDALKSKMLKARKQNAYLRNREWPYKNVKRRYIAEQYIDSSNTSDLVDYKFFCFGGVPRYCQVISGRNSNECVDFFDMEWNHLEIHKPVQCPFAEIMPERPINFDKMKEIAKLLSVGLPFVRIDLYNVKGRIYFGEYTFFPADGLGAFSPQKYDKLFGDLIEI